MNQKVEWVRNGSRVYQGISDKLIILNRIQTGPGDNSTHIRDNV